eukprot:8988121-Alexandrium_andersonii.AAC.1
MCIRDRRPLLRLGGQEPDPPTGGGGGPLAVDEGQGPEGGEAAPPAPLPNDELFHCPDPEGGQWKRRSCGKVCATKRGLTRFRCPGRKSTFLGHRASHSMWAVEGFRFCARCGAYSSMGR